MHLAAYLEQLTAQGRCYFTLVDVMQTLGLSRNAALNAILRLREKGAVASPAKGFYLIVPPEFKVLESLPAEYFIPDLMRFLDMRYYVCLLSAAQYYGAAHQQPQVFQVMVEQTHRPIICGKVKIQFIKKKTIQGLPVQQFNSPVSAIAVSSPELTAMDLLLYPVKAGGINHIATVLTELIEVMDGNKLLELAKQSSQIAWVQRLGYLLEYTSGSKNDIVKNLKCYIKAQHPQTIPLVQHLSMTNMPRDYAWNIAINFEVESDL